MNHPQTPVSAALENRAYGFQEIAIAYFPNIAPASASIRLKAWIKDDPDLLLSMYTIPPAASLNPSKSNS